MPRLLRLLDNRPVLTVADSVDAARHGAMLGVGIAQERIVFEANLAAVRQARLNLSSRLLRLATEVIQ